MKQMEIFNYQNRRVRVKEIDGKPYFVAKDICLILEIDNVSHALSRLDDDEKGIILNDTLGGDQSMAAVNEPGLYALILGSRKPDAKEFKRWVTHEVLPSIREKGVYAKDMSQVEILAALAQEAVKLEKRIDATEKRLTETIETITAEPAGDWQETINNDVRKMCYKHGLDYHNEFSDLYATLEATAGADLKSRVSRKQKRMAEMGAKVTQIRAVNKLNVIAEDAKLKAIFEGILTKRKLRHDEEAHSRMEGCR
jgi:prophage antirepressor-like protein